MVISKVRATGSRRAVVAGMAKMMIAGSAVVTTPAPAAAKPVSCEVQLDIAWGYLAIAKTMDNLGYTNLYNYHYGKYEVLVDAFYPC